MEYRQIQIDLAVHKKIEGNRQSFGETPNDVLRRVFGLAIPSTPSLDQKRESKSGWMLKAGVWLPEGTKLRAKYKGKMIEAEVIGNGLKCKGENYRSPSAAACAATGTSVNGWHFWDFFDDSSGTWRPISSLRN